MIILFIFALLLGTIIHIGVDRHRESVDHPIVHWQSAALVLFTTLAMGFVTQEVIDAKYGAQEYYRWWHFTIFSLTIHFSLFDIIWNSLHGHPWNYHGTPSNPNRAWTDKFWDMLPWWGEIFVRLWVPAVGYGVYFNWNLIVGK